MSTSSSDMAERPHEACFVLTAGQLYSLNHKIAFLSHLMGVSGAICVLYLKVLMQRKFVAEF